jgi:hypothetical protein
MGNETVVVKLELFTGRNWDEPGKSESAYELVFLKFQPDASRTKALALPII